MAVFWKNCFQKKKWYFRGILENVCLLRWKEIFSRNFGWKYLQQKKNDVFVEFAFWKKKWCFRRVSRDFHQSGSSSCCDFKFFTISGFRLTIEITWIESNCHNFPMFKITKLEDFRHGKNLKDWEIVTILSSRWLVWNLKLWKILNRHN